MTDTKFLSLKNVFRLHALLAALYAVFLIIFPQEIINFLSDVSITIPGSDVTRLFGAALILVTFLAWQASKSDTEEIQKLVANGLLLYTTLGLIISTWGQFLGHWTIIGLSNIGTYLIFVLGYGYFLYVKKP